MTTPNMVTKSNLVQLDSVIMATDPYDYISGVIRWKLKELIDSRDRIKAEIETETAKGITNGVPHWRDGKYLVLVHPVIQGSKRVREYIGSDPEKCREAIAKVARYENVVSMQWSLGIVEKQIARLKFILKDLLRELGMTWNETDLLLRFMDGDS